MKLLNYFFVPLLGGINLLLSLLVKLSNFRIDQFHLFYFSLDIQVLIFFTLDSQLQIVNEFLVLSYIELKFRTML